MKYASVIIGLIVLIVVLGVIFAVMPRTTGVAGLVAPGTVAYTYPTYSAGLPEAIPLRSYNLQPVSYQASAIGTVPAGYAAYQYQPSYQASVLTAVPVNTAPMVRTVAVNAPV